MGCKNDHRFFHRRPYHYNAAVVYQREGGDIERLSYDELDRLSNRVANSLPAIGVKCGDAVAIAMPMTIEAVAAYLGIVKAGCIVVSIADSFAAEEIATRLRISGARVVFTQDFNPRAGKKLPMYQKVMDAGAETAVVAAAEDTVGVELRDRDRAWQQFLADDDSFEPVPGEPGDAARSPPRRALRRGARPQLRGGGDRAHPALAHEGARGLRRPHAVAPRALGLRPGGTRRHPMRVRCVPLSCFHTTRWRDALWRLRIHTRGRAVRGP